MRSSAALVCQGRAMDQCWIRAVYGVPVRETFAGLIAVVIWSSAVASPLIDFTEEVACMFGGVAGDGGEGWRGVVEKLGGEDVEGRGVVHVVPEREDDGFLVCGRRSGDGWGVGVDEADTAVAAGEKVFCGGEETFAEAVAALRD